MQLVSQCSCTTDRPPKAHFIRIGYPIADEPVETRFSLSCAGKANGRHADKLPVPKHSNKLDGASSLWDTQTPQSAKIWGNTRQAEVKQLLASGCLDPRKQRPLP